jgi:hypothetical protein
MLPSLATARNDCGVLGPVQASLVAGIGYDFSW